MRLGLPNRSDFQDEEAVEKGSYAPEVTGAEDATATELAKQGKSHLHRGLNSRQVAMIAIGGAIGTGLVRQSEDKTRNRTDSSTDHRNVSPTVSGLVVNAEDLILSKRAGCTGAQD